ncbi:MAG TPA: pyridoxal-phosphate dependent enzyme [Acidimicrobiales bacterium]|nr:pyridoxal-phosphate dependent enzyme [Acidimicrobiales bacterium]
MTLTSPVRRPTSEDLERARRVVADHLVPTPTVTLDVAGRRVAAKLEGLQVTGSFKVRGGLAAIDAARRDDPGAAVITASAGNHGLGVAHAATTLGVRATVVVPANASVAKVERLRRYDIELIEHGRSYDHAQARAKELARERSLRYVSAFNNPHVIAGQATVFLEMLDQCEWLDHVVVPVGGGGLISGVLLARDERGRADVAVTGAQPERSHAMYDVLAGRAMSDVEHSETIADGLAGGGDEDSVTNVIIAEHGVELVLVPEERIRAGVRVAAATHGLVLEGSSTTALMAIADGLAGADAHGVGFIASGRNIAADLLARLVIEA